MSMVSLEKHFAMLLFNQYGKPECCSFTVGYTLPPNEGISDKNKTTR